MASVRLRPHSDDIDEELLAFSDIASKTDHLPLGDARSLWAADALILQDAQINEAEDFFRERALDAARILIDRYEHKVRVKPKPFRLLRRVFLVLLVLLAALSTWLLVVTPKQRESRAEINSRGFAHIAKNTKWDMQKPMLWGYFFTSEWKLPLEISRRLLGLIGFRFVDLSCRDDKIWWLHLECDEVHNINTLSVRDVRLSRFASLMYSGYDGWDVGPTGTPAESTPQ